MLKFLTKTSVFLALTYAAFIGSTLDAQASNLFEVKNVNVDAEASSALEARGIALKRWSISGLPDFVKTLNPR